MGLLGPPKPPAPLDVVPRWEQKRHTTWRGKSELQAHNRAFDASQLSKRRTQAQRVPPTPPRVTDTAAIRSAADKARARVAAYRRRQQPTPALAAPQTYDDDSFDFEDEAPAKLPWYSQDRARKLATRRAREERAARSKQKEVEQKQRETVEARLERVQRTILQRRRDRQGTFEKGSAVLVRVPPTHEKTLNWKPHGAWRPGPYANPQTTSMARTRLFGAPPADSKKVFRDAVAALAAPARPPRKIAAAAAGWRKAWSAVRAFARTDARCVQQRRARLQAEVRATRAMLRRRAKAPGRLDASEAAIAVKAGGAPVSPPEAPKPSKAPRSPRSGQRVRTPGFRSPMPDSPHRPPTRPPPAPPARMPPTPPPAPPADDPSPREFLARLRQEQSATASTEGSLLRSSSRDALPAGTVLGGRPARSAPVASAADKAVLRREEPPSREEPSVDAQVEELADVLDDDAAVAASPDILARLRSEQPAASTEGSLLRRSREQQASSLWDSREQTEVQQVEALADVLENDDDDVAAPEPGASASAPAASTSSRIAPPPAPATVLRQLDMDASSDLDVFARDEVLASSQEDESPRPHESRDSNDLLASSAGSLRLSGGSSFAEMSKADDASSSLLESKDFKLHGDSDHSDYDP